MLSMDYKRELYKCSKIGTVEDARARRNQRLTIVRQSKRENILDLKRGTLVDENEEPVQPPAPVQQKKTRAEMLQLWKAEKQRKLEILKREQKPVFKVGIVHHKSSGSPFKNVTNKGASKQVEPTNVAGKVKKQEVRAGVVTRSRAKGVGQIVMKAGAVSIFSQIVSNKKKPINNHQFVVPKAVSQLHYSLKATIPHSPNITKSGRKSVRANVSETKSCTRAKKNLALSETFQKSPVKEETMVVLDMNRAVQESVQQEIKTNSPLLQHPTVASSTDFAPIHYSPYVNKSRGSQRISTGTKKKLTLAEKLEQEIQKEEKEFACRIFSHRKYLECETARLLEECEKWENVKCTWPGLPVEVEGEIAAVIGKTKLLTSDKFKQFKELIDKCEKGDTMVKIDDLQGFQDWVALEVENVDKTFCKLTEMKAAEFKINKTEKPSKKTTAPFKPAQQPVKPAQQPVNKPKPKGGVAGIRAHILAARQLMKQNTVNTVESPNNFTQMLQLDTASPKKTPARTPKKDLIKQVLNSEAKKRNSGIEIMLASQLAKTLTPTKSPFVKRLMSSCSPDNGVSQMTPGKSILKHASTPHSTRKRTVLFSLTNSPGVKSRGISEKYFAPLNDSTDSVDSNESINMGAVTSTTPTKRRRPIFHTPLRRSTRLACRTPVS